MLKSKAVRYGTSVVTADRWFPSSKLCSTPGCGYLKKDLMLKDRIRKGPAWGTTHNRDHSAASEPQGAGNPNYPTCGDAFGNRRDGFVPGQDRRESHAWQTRNKTRWAIGGRLRGRPGQFRGRRSATKPQATPGFGAGTSAMGPGDRSAEIGGPSGVSKTRQLSVRKNKEPSAAPGI